jgi:hypothetical protein
MTLNVCAQHGSNDPTITMATVFRAENLFSRLKGISLGLKGIFLGLKGIFLGL